MTLARVHIYQEQVCKTLIAFTIASLMAYVVCLGLIMYNASIHTTLTQEIGKTTGSLAELEFDYITLKQSVTLEKAYEFGFVEIKNPYFVKLSEDTAVTLR